MIENVGNRELYVKSKSRTFLTSRERGVGKQDERKLIRTTCCMLMWAALNHDMGLVVSCRSRFGLFSPDDEGYIHRINSRRVSLPPQYVSTVIAWLATDCVRRSRL